MTMMSLLKVPSGDAMMVGRMFTPEGVGPHPTLLLLHGFPGAQQNHDLAVAMRKAGWSVLLLNYRGAWGSQGNFSFANALEDVQAALAYLRREDVVAEFKLDTSKLVLVGHSMGGFLSLMTTAGDADVTGVASISGFNFGLAAEIVGDDERSLAEVTAMFEESTFFLTGINGRELTQQIADHGAAWNLVHQAKSITTRPVLLLGALRDDVGPTALHHDSLVEAFQRANAQHLQHLTVDTDHNWDDAREALAEHLLSWLAKI
ncbi:alpha/beta fold hydrolase [Tumebacillus sp. ITR2]|uniref:Alpha/beta fold hydrolase n=1 Tax=Tumebacillus amylolyticus TaxID=2801339 RepID=A0ABS1J4Z3_9BACL|nr:alpha/beta fold hydrolase [Tumebacillus amylolyticus]MBL0385260.1 alpha/beta fold hydrolase [Tumebacillus amylolyticus]